MLSCLEQNQNSYTLHEGKPPKKGVGEEGVGLPLSRRSWVILWAPSMASGSGSVHFTLNYHSSVRASLGCVLLAVAGELSPK